MIGQGVLREALDDARVEHVTCVVRAPLRLNDPKLTEIIETDLFRLDVTAQGLSGFDACLFCAGISSAGLSEAIYTKLTYDMTLHVANALLPENPDLTFLYVSGAGTDSTGQGRFMWARVKGRLENALLNLPFKAAYMFRPGAIQPLNGIKSKTGWYNLIYTVTALLAPLLVKHLPDYVTTTQALAKAMLNVAAKGSAKRILESADINTAGA